MNLLLISWFFTVFKITTSIEFLGWVAWSSWTECSKSCGSGIRTRALICPSNSSLICNQKKFSPVQTEACNLRVCPTPKWGEWTAWSICSSSCKRFRQRDCRIPGSNAISPVDPMGCGQTTLTPTNYTETCTGGACDFGEWSIWLRWSRCDCRKNQQFRRRYCSGKVCKGSSYITKLCDADARIICDGSAKHKKESDTQETAEKSVKLENLIESDEELEQHSVLFERVTSESHNGIAEHIEWTSWTSWSICDCYTGRSYRQRMCALPKPPAIFIHSHCPGSSTSERDCEPTDCNEISGGWSGWSPWSDCPQNCGLGCQYRVRMCAHSMPINGGSSCPGNSRELKLCPVRDCTGESRDGQWSSWSNWSECSVTCGSGVHTRSRHCTSPNPSNGGQYCIGNNVETKACESDSVSNCQKLVAGGWSHWTDWTPCDGRNTLSWRFCTEPKPRGKYSRCNGRARKSEDCTIQ